MEMTKKFECGSAAMLLPALKHVRKWQKLIDVTDDVCLLQLVSDFEI